MVTDRARRVRRVDWESATAPGLPLWDLTYFLADALTLLDSGGSPTAPPRCCGCSAARHRWSPLLFAHLRRAVRAPRLSPRGVGPLVTLGWLHHGLCPPAAAPGSTPLADGRGTRARDGLIPPLAGPWLGDPDARRRMAAVAVTGYRLAAVVRRRGVRSGRERVLELVIGALPAGVAVAVVGLERDGGGPAGAARPGSAR